MCDMSVNAAGTTLRHLLGKQTIKGSSKRHRLSRTMYDSLTRSPGPFSLPTNAPLSYKTLHYHHPFLPLILFLCLHYHALLHTRLLLCMLFLVVTLTSSRICVLCRVSLLSFIQWNHRLQFLSSKALSTCCAAGQYFL